MKTPREFLLRRHAPANEKLDAIREEAVRAAADVNRRSAPNREATFAAAVSRMVTTPFREIILPARRIWAGFAVAWLVIVAAHLADTERTARTEAGLRPAPAGMLMAWERQQKLMAELIGQTETQEGDRPKPARPQPRTQRQPEWSII
jgi:hypothetical protein